MEKEKSFRFFAAAFYAFAFFGICVYVLPRVIKILLPFIVAYFISFLITPISEMLYERCRIPKRIAIAVLMLLIISLLVLIAFNLIYQAVFAMQSFSQTLPDIFDGTVPKWADGIYNFYLMLPTSKQVFIDEIFKAVQINVSDIVSKTASLALNVARRTAAALPDIFVFTTVVILATYFICADRTRIEKTVMSFFPKRADAFFKKFKYSVKKALGGYVTAQLILMCVCFAVLFPSLLVLKIKYAFFSAAIISLVDALPVFGAGAILIPWSVLKLLHGNYFAAVYLFCIYLIVILLRNFLEPKIVGRRLGINPLITLFAMFVGYKTAGVVGLAAGPAAALVLLEFLKKENIAESD